MATLYYMINTPQFTTAPCFGNISSFHCAKLNTPAQRQCAMTRIMLGMRSSRLRMITVFKRQYPGWCFPLRQTSLVMYSLDNSHVNAIVEAENQRGLKHKDFNEETYAPLPNMFGYFHVMRTCHAKLRYFGWDGQVHFAKGKTRGQHDPLKILVFNLTTLHLRGRTLAKYPQARRLLLLTMGTSTPR